MLRDHYIEEIAAGGEIWHGKPASELTNARRFALVPVIVEGDNLMIGFHYELCDDTAEFNKFMERAEKLGQ